MEISEFDIDLSVDPSKRWNTVITKYKKDLIEIIKWYKSSFPFLSIAAPLAKPLLESDFALHTDEIKGIANLLKVSSTTHLLQFIYEINAGCTSIITHYQDGGTLRPHQYRSMDWPLETLKNITIKINVIKDGQLLYSAITWAGYVGILTAITNNYSIAVNFRKSTGSIINSISNASNGFWPIGFLVRKVCEKGKSYEHVVKVLSETDLISPTYFSLVGTKEKEGCIITRDPQKLISLETLKEKPYLIQTNLDNKLGEYQEKNDILQSKLRIKVAKDYLKNKVEKYITTKEELDTLFIMAPISNDIMVYKCYMCPYNKVINGVVPH